jgi:hypothetical protein
MKKTALDLCKLTAHAAIAVLFWMAIPCLSATEEISEFWASVRVYSPDPSGEGEKVVARAEEDSRADVPGGKRAFRLPAQSGAFLRFNPVTDANEPRDLSSAKIIKVQVHASNPTTFSVRLAGGGPSMLGKMEHSGGGWELLEFPLDEESLLTLGQSKLNKLFEVTLVDFIVTGEVFDGDDYFLVSDFVAE